MSSQKGIIEVFPPNISISQESYNLCNFECPTCRGKGYHEEQINREEYKQIACSRCDGTGRMKAEIVVAWEPDYGY